MSISYFCVEMKYHFVEPSRLPPELKQAEAGSVVLVGPLQALSSSKKILQISSSPLTDYI